MFEKIKKFIKEYDYIENEIINPVAFRLLIMGYSGNFNDIKEAAEFEKQAKKDPSFRTGQKF